MTRAKSLLSVLSCSPCAARALARWMHVDASAVNRNATTSTLQRFAISTQGARCSGYPSHRSTYAHLPARTVSSTSARHLDRSRRSWQQRTTSRPARYSLWNRDLPAPGRPTATMTRPFVSGAFDASLSSSGDGAASSSAPPQAWAAADWRSLRAIESVSQRSPTSCAAPALARTVAGSTFSAAITTKSLPSLSEAACDGLRNAAPAPIFASQSFRWNGLAPMTVIFAPAKQAIGGAAVLAFFLGAILARSGRVGAVRLRFVP
mmetsp:Transcript_23488/g.65885  ORF Transcript_23488/g.65885 Transcript_23488/m.65885 type:complete len:263 (+) Transcript_23488:441-1229(+)